MVPRETDPHVSQTLFSASIYRETPTHFQLKTWHKENVSNARMNHLQEHVKSDEKGERQKKIVQKYFPFVELNFFLVIKILILLRAFLILIRKLQDANSLLDTMSKTMYTHLIA